VGAAHRMEGSAAGALTALAITVERVAREPALVVRLAGLLVIRAAAWEIVRAM